MRILIVDDHAARYRKLIDSLVDLGVLREEIDLSSCTSDARDKLEITKYDLLILDLLIPYYPEGEPEVRHSEDLLNDLNLSSEYEKPVKIIGITADKKALSKTISQFEMETWQVIQYEHSCTDWIQKIENCVRYLKEKNNVDQPKSYDFDLAIICALDEPELSEVLKLDWNWSLPKPIDDNTFIYEGSVLLNGRPIKISATHASRMGMVATAIKTASIINILRPRLVVMTGICGGVKKHTNYGDVIFAECAWDYQSGKLKREDGQSVFEVSPHQLMATTQVRSKMELLKADKKFISEISQDFDGHLITNPKLLLGPIATGAAVVADPVYVNTIVGNNKKVLGIEMEIYGLYSAVENSSNPRPKVFALKSVCDFADAKKDDDYQKYCSYMSANVLRVFIERYGDYFF